MLMFATFGRVDFAGVNAGVPGTNTAVLTAMGLLLLLGACGKSAQFPLQSWLGDAMAGPTPVSALIHAATMVTAGVYLVVRSHVIFNATPTAQLVVTIVGAITLVFGAVVGCAKDDIKKALAASTMSQIGYMMLAAGLGPVGYAFAIFHLLTHGFFKAGMFLGAGSVMHGMNDQVNMRGFGRLSGVLKITWVTFGLGWLAILGVFPFSGFWSKDKIIEAAFIGEGWRPWVFGGDRPDRRGRDRLLHVAAVLHDLPRQEALERGRQHPHESPLVMTVPMMVLAVGSAFLGLLLGPTGAITSWLDPVVGAEPAGDHPVLPVPVLLVLTSLLDHRRHRAGLAAVLARGRARRGPARLAGHPRRPPRPLPGRRQRGRPHAPRHPPHPVAGLLRPQGGRRRHRWDGRAGRRLVRTAAPCPERLRPFVCPDDAPGRRRDPRCRLGGAVMSSFPWLTTIGLIPLVGALVVALLPASVADKAKHLAVGFSVVTLLFTIAAALQFKTGSNAQFQLVEQHAWIPQFGVSYALGVDGIALVLIAMSAVLVPVCLLAAWHDVPEVGRRQQNYFALMLVLETFMVGVFAATDVFLFYVLFEAMLIPVYFLIGSYGGARRQYAAVKFLLFGLTGGLVMLVAVIALYFQGPGGPDGFLFTNLLGLQHGPDHRAAAVPRLLLRVRDQGAAVAGAHLAAGRRGRGPAGHRRAAHRRARQGRHLRHDPLLPAAVPRRGQVGDARGDRAGGRSRSCTARCSRSARPTSCG